MIDSRNPPEGCRPAPRVSFFTLGCRLNQHDTAAMRSDLEREGWETAPAREAADVVIVNTCTVTRRADQESRQLIRRLVRERPGARIVVTGCYAQRAPGEIQTLPGVSLVLGTSEREAIASKISAPRAGASVAPGRARRSIGLSAPLHFGRTRALLKIQDGCDSFCSYCIVPYVRGRSRSLPPAEALDRARRLLDAGFQELVLTGADLGAYGRDLGESALLPKLVESLLALGARHRVRLSSIEPNKVDEALVDAMAREPRFCRHLHLPLQSGSPAILRAMRRGYEPRDYARLVERAAAGGPIGIGADVIVGFPGEGEAEFEETMSFVSALPISFLHVFRYSPRPGTAAVRLPASAAAVPDAVARERADRLRALGEAKQ
ncbi:MAG TPA: tRNA (N(6)-L-threonylcarbamoyladenosine(37)-C(2))-methylthiotransferase MtaB, partial [Candidatus Eisenbacteria bacterium]